MALRSSVANGGVEKTTSSTPADGGQEKQKKLLEAEAGHFSIINLFRKKLASTGLTGRPGFCGFMSILSSMRYCLGNPQSYTPMWFALAFMPFGLFFDFMDGKVARWRKKSSLMGQELDSLADLVRPKQLSSKTVPLRIALAHEWTADGVGLDRYHSASPPPRPPSRSGSAPRSTLSSCPSSSSAASRASPASTSPSRRFRKTPPGKASTLRERPSRRACA
ncbi:MAG: hypothetical protein LQ346_001555 [Caloplaca aetnensis]|nr:MAG: hypothetical protein LQ346_001555 [Caloplaca aetnensis]